MALQLKYLNTEDGQVAAIIDKTLKELLDEQAGVAHLV